MMSPIESVIQGGVAVTVIILVYRGLIPFLCGALEQVFHFRMWRR